MVPSSHPGLITLTAGTLLSLIPCSGSAQVSIPTPASSTASAAVTFSSDAAVVPAPLTEQNTYTDNAPVLNPPPEQVSAGALQAHGSTTTKGILSEANKDRLRRIKHRLQPISSSGVRADVLARALTATTDNDRGRQIAVLWSQAMPGGHPAGERNTDRQFYQNQEQGKLQFIQLILQPNYGYGYRYRTEVSLKRPSGNLDHLKWTKPGTPLLAIGGNAFVRSEIDITRAGDFKKHSDMYFKAETPLILRQGDQIPFNQVILTWKPDDSRPAQFQMLLLRGEQRNQFRVCFNVASHVYRGSNLTCNVWQVPHDYWRRPQPLEYVGPYMVSSSEEGENRYWRYRP